MDILGDDADIQAMLGRDEDFVGIENDALPDFTQLEHFINSDNDEHNNYFADTLANQEASRHGGSVSSNADVIVDSSALMATHRPVSGRIYGNNPALPHPPPPPTGIGRTSHHGVQYNSARAGTAIHCNAFNIAHSLPESPPDSVSEPPYSPPETTHSGSSVGGSPLSDHCTGQRYLLSSANDAYGTLFGPTLDLKNDLAGPHVSYLNAASVLQQQQQQQQQQPQSLPTILSAALLAGGGSSNSTNSNNTGSSNNTMVNSHSVLTGTSSSANPCMSSATPTIYTIEDHGGGNPLITLATNNVNSNPAGQKKRKLSISDTFPIVSNPSGVSSKSMNVKQEPQLSPASNTSPRQVAIGTEEDYSYEFSADSSMFNDNYQCIRFQAFQQSTWHSLFDRHLKELPLPNFRVDADKGFNFSNTDDAFVCQKKNHFQITCHVQQNGEPFYVKTTEGLKKVDHFYLHFFGVKVEAPTQMIRVEQSQSDRSKKPFHPVLLELQQDQVSKITVGRLHFNETTANNMRKKGKPNPDQRFFYLVVSLQAHCGEATYTIVAHSSERIIVRASNPGMFENEVEQTWQRGATSDSVFHAGRVGINTDRPDEALVVHGNLKITGHLMQPSDLRAKERIEEVDTKEQLRNVQALRVVHYKYTEEFAETAGLSEDERADTGVIAQEVESIIPDAVRPAGNILLPDGRQIENFLVVNKERIFMENVGAVKELCKVTDNLENRIDELERMNRKLTKLKRLDSIRSSSSGSTGKPALNVNLHNVGSVASNVRNSRRRNNCSRGDDNICSNRFVQMTVVILVMIMAFCLIAMATLYIVEWQKRNAEVLLQDTNSSPERHTLLNFTHSSVDDYDVISDSMLDVGRNNTSKPPDLSTSSMSNNSTFVTVITSSVASSGKQNGISTSNTSSMVTTPARSFTLSHTKPDPVGKPGSCPLDSVSSVPCQVYCCISNLHNTSTTPIPMTMSARRVGGDVTRTMRLVADMESTTSSSTTEMFNNNLDNSGKLSKNRGLPGQGGPSDRGSSDLRMGPSQFFYQKNWDKKFNRVIRVQRHLSNQHRDLGSRGPTGEDYLLSHTRTPMYKITSNQPTAWDGRVEYVRLVGAQFNVTLGPNYCMPDSLDYFRCLNGNADNYTYGIPLSKYMPDPSITLQFHFPTLINSQPEQCSSPLRTGSCADRPTLLPSASTTITRGPTREHADSVDRTFYIDVGRTSIVAYRFRFPIVRGDTGLCRMQSTTVGTKFVEYNLVFYRVCDD